jgi:hypothetical protein
MNLDFSTIEWKKSPYCFSWIGLLLILFGIILLLISLQSSSLNRSGIGFIVFGFFIEIIGLVLSICELKKNRSNLQTDYTNLYSEL